MKLQSKFGFCYPNFKYCTLNVSWTEFCTDKQMDGQMIQTLDAPGGPFGKTICLQPIDGGIKIMVKHERSCHNKWTCKILPTVDGLNFVGFQFSWWV